MNESAERLCRRASRCHPRRARLTTIGVRSRASGVSLAPGHHAREIRGAPHLSRVMLIDVSYKPPTLCSYPCSAPHRPGSRQGLHGKIRPPARARRLCRLDLAPVPRGRERAQTLPARDPALGWPCPSKKPTCSICCSPPTALPSTACWRSRSRTQVSGKASATSCPRALHRHRAGLAASALCAASHLKIVFLADSRPHMW